MKEPKDKRTKAYKKWLANQEKQEKKLALGDKIADFTKATGINKAVKYVFGEDCGCEERQEYINKTVSKLFGRTHVHPLTEDEYNYVLSTKDLRRLNSQQQREMTKIYERVFNVKIVSSCSSCSFPSKVWRPLLRLVEAYN